jgi:hypothetical protein
MLRHSKGIRYLPSTLCIVIIPQSLPCAALATADHLLRLLVVLQYQRCGAAMRRYRARGSRSDDD